MKLYRSKLGNRFGYKNKTTGKKVNEKPVNNPNIEKINPSVEEEEIIMKLNCFFQPYGVFIDFWDKVFNIRNVDYNTMEFNDLITKWPVLSDPNIAYHLVSSYKNKKKIVIFIYFVFRFLTTSRESIPML